MAKARRVSLLTVPGMTGRLHLSPLPGTWEGAADPGSVRRDLRAIAAAGATLLVTLVEAAELPLELAEWRAEVAAAGLAFLHLPIPDFGVPDAAFEPAWGAAGLAARLAAGETVAIHCRAGLGRTGTIAARLMMEAAGLDAAAAIATIRRDHATEAVETAAQAAWVHAAQGHDSRGG